MCHPGGRVCVPRPSCVTIAETLPSFDLDFPVDCDDEYWSHPDPAQSFKQPAGKPSTLSYFISSIKLNQILGFALRTIVRAISGCYLRGTSVTECPAPFVQYSINKSKVLLGFVGPHWEQQIVAELDSALNKWVDSVPDHRMSTCPLPPCPPP